jgi:hypothetical protein
MVTFIPRRYTQPKWQIKIIEKDKQFVFPSGAVVTTPFEFKQALMTVPEEDIHTLATDKEHHIANWFEFVIGDVDLANELRKYNHRWGMVVALERQQMRTLNLPPHVAKYWLRKVEIPFTFVTGEEVKSSKELGKAIAKVSDDTVDFHLEREPNDISLWVTEIIGDYELSELLEESSNRTQMEHIISDHLVKLVEAQE